MKTFLLLGCALLLSACRVQEQRPPKSRYGLSSSGRPLFISPYRPEFYKRPRPFLLVSPQKAHYEQRP